MGKARGGVDAELVVHEFLGYLNQKYGIDRQELNRLISKEQKPDAFSVPVEILGNRKLGCMEAAVKFLRENKGLAYNKISELLGRSRSTIGVMYHNASRKMGQHFQDYPSSKYPIPASRFADKKFSALESVVMFLADHKLRVCEIAGLLNRDYRTIYTVYRRGRRKNEA